MYTYVDLELDVRGVDCTVQADAYITTGGSDRHGSDDPAWREVTDAALSHVDGRKLRADAAALVWAEHGDYITTKLLESVD